MGALGHTLLYVTNVAAFGTESKTQTKRTSSTGLWWHIGLPPQQFRKRRQEDCKFKASLGSFVYPCLKFEKNQKGRQRSSVVEYLLSSSASMRRALSLISGTGKKQDKTTKIENKTKQTKPKVPGPSKQVAARARTTLNSRPGAGNIN